MWVCMCTHAHARTHTTETQIHAGNQGLANTQPRTWKWGHPALGVCRSEHGGIRAPVEGVLLSLQKLRLQPQGTPALSPLPALGQKPGPEWV